MGTLARQRAVKKGKTLAQMPEDEKVTEKSSNPEFRLATFEDLQEDYRTALVTAPSGMGFEIQSIDAGGITQISGQPFINLMAIHGVRFDNNKPMMEQLLAIPKKRQQEIVESSEYEHYLNSIVCAGVISVQLLDKLPQNMTSAEKEEKKVSVYRLGHADRLYLFTEIMKLTLDEAYTDTFDEFRKADNQEGK